ALLRAVMYQAVFANVEVARASPAAPLVGTPLGNVVLEAVDAGEAALLHRLHLGVHPPLIIIQRLQLPRPVMNDSDSGAEAQAQSAPADGKSVLRILYSAAHHGIDVHVEIGIRGEELVRFVQYLQTFFRALIRRNVVDRNLQPLETGAVEALNPF